MASRRNDSSMVLANIGRFEVVKPLGKGASGTVYLCNDSLYGRDIAIKVYDSLSADHNSEESANLRKMFLTEESIIGKLTHPNILEIYETGIENDRLFVATEYVHGGRTTAAYGSSRNLLPIHNVVEIVSKCAKALNFAHNLGVIHRDIKPGNIMLTIDNDVRVIDFGVAIVNDSELSMINGVAGSPAYMAPEQIRGDPITHSSDLYSLGIVAYRLLTGRLPFRADSIAALLDEILNSEPIEMDTYRKDIPPDLAKIVNKLVARNAADRYESGLAIALDLSRVYQAMGSGNVGEDNRRLGLLRKLEFFRDFSAQEIRELVQIARWTRFGAGKTVTDDTSADAQFFVVLDGTVSIVSSANFSHSLSRGGCFGGTGNSSSTTVVATTDVVILRISAHLLEQTSARCQLMFNKTFLNALIARLEGGRQQTTRSDNRDGRSKKSSPNAVT